MKLTELMFDTFFSGKEFPNLVCYAAYLDMDYRQIGRRDLQVGVRIDGATLTLVPSTEDRGQVGMIQIYDAENGGNLLFQWEFSNVFCQFIKKGDVIQLHDDPE